jgi:hypothetical protein
VGDFTGRGHRHFVVGGMGALRCPPRGFSRVFVFRSYLAALPTPPALLNQNKNDSNTSDASCLKSFLRHCPSFGEVGSLTMQNLNYPPANASLRLQQGCPGGMVGQQAGNAAAEAPRNVKSTSGPGDEGIAADVKTQMPFRPGPRVGHADARPFHDHERFSHG